MELGYHNRDRLSAYSCAAVVDEGDVKVQLRAKTSVKGWVGLHGTVDQPCLPRHPVDRQAIQQNEACREVVVG